ESDRGGLVRFFEELSQRSLFLRFHGIPRVDARLVEPVLDPDWADRGGPLAEPVLDPDWAERGALLAAVAEDGEDRIVALANYVRLRDPRTAEVAFAVADDHHGRRAETL